MTYGIKAAVFDALGDGARREILEKLRGGPRAVGEIAADMTISRPAVSQHLKVLKESGLITETRQGTRHYFAIAPEGLGELRAYLDGLWGDALAAFALHVAQKEQDP